jgi:PucR family transcriptional regulator, purine catabolism regulatory protein
MPITLRDLLETDAFHLRLVQPPADAEVLERPLTWVHSSDLPDPTPWLEPGQLLLTDGDQFRRHPGRAAADEYLARLEAAEVPALGIATGVIHRSVPAALAAAAAARGFALIEVAERTPFMAVIRRVADAIAADRQERLDWLMSAQREIARAALRVDGLSAILRELERSLDAWVALFDITGESVEIATGSAIPDEVQEPVRETVRRLLRRGAHSAGRISAGGHEIELQALGHRDRLHGVLVVGSTTPLDAAGSDLLASVIGLASIGLEQNAAVDESRRALRAGVLELLLGGQVEVARRALAPLRATLPGDPVRVVVARTEEDRLLIEELELDAARGAGGFFAAAGTEVVLVTGGSLAAVEALLRRHALTAGASAPAGLDRLGPALAQARYALEAGGGSPIARFEDVVDAGALGALRRGGGRELAEQSLALVLARPNGAALLAAARVWLQHNAAWDPAARELGMHRHTLRARMTELGAILGLDLDRFGDRVELWAALRLGDAPD